MISVEGPETVAAEAKSFTGQYLRPLLARSSSNRRVKGEAPDGDPGSVEGRSPKPKPRRKASSSVDQPNLIPAK